MGKFLLHHLRHPLLNGARGEHDTLKGLGLSAGPVDAAVLPAVEAFYARHGWRVRLYPSCRARHATLDYLAGSDAERLADLQAFQIGQGEAKRSLTTLLQAARERIATLDRDAALHAAWDGGAVGIFGADAELFGRDDLRDTPLIIFRFE